MTKKLVNSILVRSAIAFRKLGLKRLPFFLMHLNAWFLGNARWRDITITQFDLVPDTGQEARCTVRVYKEGDDD